MKFDHRSCIVILSAAASAADSRGLALGVALPQDSQLMTQDFLVIPSERSESRDKAVAVDFFIQDSRLISFRTPTRHRSSMSVTLPRNAIRSKEQVKKQPANSFVF